MCVRNYLFQFEGFSYEIFERDKFIAFYYRGLLATECRRNNMNKGSASLAAICLLLELLRYKTFCRHFSLKW